VNEGYAAIAEALDDLARQVEDALAGGDPPKWVAQQGAERARAIAYMAARAGKGTLAPDGLDGLLHGDGGETMTLRRPKPEPELPGLWGRAVRYARERVAKVRAGGSGA
jgi:hypothetical protein